MSLNDVIPVIQAALIIAAWSYNYRESPIYRVAEALVLGWGMSITTKVGVDVFNLRVITPITSGNWLPIIIPVILGCTYLLRLWKPTAWLMKYNIAFSAGIGAGLAVIGVIFAQIISLVSMKSFSAPGITPFDSILITIFTFCALSYFILTREQKGPFGWITKIGLYVLVICFGWTGGTYIMSLVSFSIGGMLSITKAPGIYVLAIALIIIGADMVVQYRKVTAADAIKQS